MTVRNIKTRDGYEFWDKLCAIPRHGFIHSPDNSRVLKVEGIGNWIDMHAAQEVVDAAQDEVNGLRAERDQLRAEVKALRKDAERYRFIIDCPLRTMVALSRKAHEPGFDLSAECDSIIASRDAALAAKEGA